MNKRTEQYVTGCALVSSYSSLRYLRVFLWHYRNVCPHYRCFTAINGYVDKIHCLSDLLNSVDLVLYDKMHSKAHCLYPLLPQSEDNFNIYAVGGHDFILPSCTKDLYKKFFVMRCLFNFM